MEVLKFVTFIFIVYVQSRETVRAEKSFKLNENIIYDCVDIYKQPSLSHPLLQNHKIQMEPSFTISKPKIQVKSQCEIKKIIECPNGSVPILRNTKEYVENAQYWRKKHFNPLTVTNPGIHIAGVRSKSQGPYHGLVAWMSMHNLNISRDQISYASMYVGGGDNNYVNFIQIGWMVNPNLFADKLTWSFGVWRGAKGTGCYNTICPGFIQVSTKDPISEPLFVDPKGQKGIYLSIVQDQESGHWWKTKVKDGLPDAHIGYWPKELFDLIGESVDIVGVTGAVQASPSGISPPMGNGHLPTTDENKSARVKNLNIVDSEYKIKDSYLFKLEKLLDNDKCYGVKDGERRFFGGPNTVFTYGGPGGESCGI